MLAKKLQLALMLSILVVPCFAYARLAPSKLADLLRDSTLIVEATPLKIERVGDWDREVTLKVRRVVRGKHDAPTIVLRWGGEVHEQHIDLDVGDWLLFLRVDKDGKYVPTQYGRSYWPFATLTEQNIARRSVESLDLDGDKVGFAYEYPVSMVQLSDEDRRRVLLIRDGKPVKPRGQSGPVELISYAQLKAALSGPAK